MESTAFELPKVTCASNARFLIVTADDFGQTVSINEGVIQAFEKGIVTSASLMVRFSGASAAAQYACEHPGLSIGLHVDFGEWTCQAGHWTRIYQVVPEHDGEAVAAELLRQLETFRDLVGRDPTHLDSHQHVHRAEPALSILRSVSESLQIPLRHYSQVRYSGDFYGQTAIGLPYPEGLSLEGLMQTLAALPEGITELGCHPGSSDNVDSMYRAERVEELNILCDPRVRDWLQRERIELVSFHDFSRICLHLNDLAPRT